MAELFDTHAHLSDEAFDADRDGLIPKLPAAGVTRVIDVACDVRTAEKTLALIDRYPFIYGTIGIPCFRLYLSFYRFCPWYIPGTGCCIRK